jgi:hypothetical protein
LYDRQHHYRNNGERDDGDDHTVTITGNSSMSSRTTISSGKPGG